MRMSRTARLAVALAPALLLAACQAEEEEVVTPEPAVEDQSGGELIAVPEDSANPEGVTLPETPMTPVPAETAAADSPAQ